MIKIAEILTEVAAHASELYKKDYNSKAQPINFIADNFLIVGQELIKLGKNANAAKGKYPAILVFMDQVVERSAPALKQWEAEATLPTILIVTDAVQGNGTEKLNKVYYPILYPIAECFFDAIEAHPQIFTKGDFAPKRERFDRMNLVAVMGASIALPDKLDGIEIRNLRLYLKEKKCFTNLKKL